MIDSMRKMHDRKIHDGDFRIDDLANRNQPNHPAQIQHIIFGPLSDLCNCSQANVSAASKLFDTSSFTLSLRTNGKVFT